MTTAALAAPTPVQLERANFLNLLIVDDERAIREVCREVAQSLGFNTAVADSAEHAYRLLDTQNIDVVLLDLKLPGASGLEALRQIGERKPEAVIVVVTGYGTVQSAVPLKIEFVPNVAELPVCQKTFLAWAPPARTTCVPPMVVRVEATWKMKIAFTSPWASRVTLPADSLTVLEVLYRPGVKVKPLISPGRTAPPGNPAV